VKRVTGRARDKQIEGGIEEKIETEKVILCCSSFETIALTKAAGLHVWLLFLLNRKKCKSLRLHILQKEKN
jgi:hypothetical protein